MDYIISLSEFQAEIVRGPESQRRWKTASNVIAVISLVSMFLAGQEIAIEIQESPPTIMVTNRGSRVANPNV